MGWRSGFWLERIGEMSTETGVSSLVRRQGALFFLNFFMGARGSLDGRGRQEERKGPESHHRGSEHSDGGPGEWAEIQGTQQRAVSFS